MLFAQTSTGAALQGKNLLFESLFSILDNPCAGSALPPSIHYANVIRMNFV